MEPFDLERAKAGDPIGTTMFRMELGDEIRYIGAHPSGFHVIAICRRGSGGAWTLTTCGIEQLYMKPKPIRFWGRPWKYKGGSVPAGLLWWPEEQKQPNNVSEDGTWDWAGEAKLVEWP